MFDFVWHCVFWHRCWEYNVRYIQDLTIQYWTTSNHTNKLTSSPLSRIKSFVRSTEKSYYVCLMFWHRCWECDVWYIQDLTTQYWITSNHTKSSLPHPLSQIKNFVRNTEKLYCVWLMFWHICCESDVRPLNIEHLSLESKVLRAVLKNHTVCLVFCHRCW